MDNVENPLIQELYPFNRFLKRDVGYPKLSSRCISGMYLPPWIILTSMHPWKTSMFSSLADEGWKGKEKAKLGSGSQYCKHV